MFIHPDALSTINAQHMQDLADDAVYTRLARRAHRAHRGNRAVESCSRPSVR
jgi:hypothetical protein